MGRAVKAVLATLLACAAFVGCSATREAHVVGYVLGPLAHGNECIELKASGPVQDGTWIPQHQELIVVAPINGCPASF